MHACACTHTHILALDILVRKEQEKISCPVKDFDI